MNHRSVTLTMLSVDYDLLSADTQHSPFSREMAEVSCHSGFVVCPLPMRFGMTPGISWLQQQMVYRMAMMASRKRGEVRPFRGLLPSESRN